jgi:hypothetical protein
VCPRFDDSADNGLVPTEEVRYDQTLLDSLATQVSFVADLCRQSTQCNELLAALIEGWSSDLGCRPALARRLTSSNDSEFWSGFWELTAHRLLAAQDTNTEQEPIVGSLTPDLIATRGDKRLMIEVFTLLSSSATNQEQMLMARIQQGILAAGLTIPRGNLVLTVHGPALRQKAAAVAILQLVDALDAWLTSGASDLFDFREGDSLVIGRHFSADFDPVLTVGPAGGAFDESGRIQGPLGTKVHKYGDLASPDLNFVVMIGTTDWQVTPYAVSVAMFGPVTVTLTDSAPIEVDHSGAGVAVVGGIVGYDQARGLAGVIYSRLLNVVEGPALNLELALITNPFAEEPLSFNLDGLPRWGQGSLARGATIQLH